MQRRQRQAAAKGQKRRSALQSKAVLRHTSFGGRLPAIPNSGISPPDHAPQPLRAEMRFLILTTIYPVGPTDSYMTTELGDELVREGHTVDVISVAWSAAPGAASQLVTTKGGVRVLTIAPRAIQGVGRLIQRASKWFSSSRHSVAEVARTFDVQDYDVVVAFTPCVAIASLLRWSEQNRKANRVLFIYDFFPIHHREVGLIPRPAYGLLKAWETKLMRTFDLIVCNLPSNIAYLRANYRLRSDQAVTSTPLWTVAKVPALRSRQEVRQGLGLPEDRKIAIFGGQLTEGRGIEMMLEAAALARAGGEAIDFLFAGSGRLEHLVKARAAEPESNVRHIAWIDRLDYMSVVAACDVGLVATVEGVSSHSFPTKLIDYVKAGIPVVSAVETGSDFSKIISDYGLGASVPVGDPRRFYEAVRSVTGDAALNAGIRAMSLRCLTEHLDVRHACALMRQRFADNARQTL